MNENKKKTEANLEQLTPRWKAVARVMALLHDALEIEGNDMATWHDQGYAVAEFEHDGWIMRAQITSRRPK